MYTAALCIVLLACRCMHASCTQTFYMHAFVMCIDKLHTSVYVVVCLCMYTWISLYTYMHAFCTYIVVRICIHALYAHMHWSIDRSIVCFCLMYTYVCYMLHSVCVRIYSWSPKAFFPRKTYLDQRFRWRHQSCSIRFFHSVYSVLEKSFTFYSDWFLPSGIETHSRVLVCVA